MHMQLDEKEQRAILIGGIAFLLICVGAIGSAVYGLLWFFGIV